MRTTRRRFLTMAAGGALVAGASGRTFARQDVTGWDLVPQILARITAPRFPDRRFDITAFGARDRATTDATNAIRMAVSACAAAGGGRVVVPAGRFITGPIHLASNVNLHLEDEATLAFARDPKAYLPLVLTRFEGMELWNYSPLIYAIDAANVAVTGRGTLDGQADFDHWWSWKGAWKDVPARPGQPTQIPARLRLAEMVEAGRPVSERVFGEDAYLRSSFVQPYRCQNVLIEGVTIVNSPMWEIHPVLCRNVTVRDVTVRTHGPNNDGCNPESSRDVLIERCTFDTGDDCIALKSGRNAEGRRLNTPVENVVIRDCEMRDGHGAVVVGSEASGGARNIFAERCRMDSPQLDRALRFKTNSVRGGVIEHVYMRDVTIGQVAEAVVTADFFYEEGDSGRFPPTLRDVELRNVTSQKSRYGLLLRGYAHSPISNVRVIDCRFDGVAEGDRLEGVRDLVFVNTRVNGALRNERISR
ncbi:MAG: glycoside hydrolase family 28 protein [Acidobacteria bacterium]|nr:glycoside hydrolase family 28 protein [Acidobacteriota bacterium]